MKASLALAVVLLLGLGCERNRASTCVTGASNPCTCTTGATGAQTCQDDGTFGACQCAPTPTPVVAPVAVATPDVPVAVAPVAVAPVAAAPTAPRAPRAPSAPSAAAPAGAASPNLGLPNVGLPGVVMPTLPTQGNTTSTPTAADPRPSTAPSAEQFRQLGQLVSQGLNPQQLQSITNAITSANRTAAPDHPTFSPTELTRLSEMATQGGAGPSALQSAAQSMLGGN